MFWSKIVKRFGPLSSEVRYGLRSLVNNNFHHEKLLKECFVMIILLFITGVQAPSDFYLFVCFFLGGGGVRVGDHFARKKKMQCPNVRVFKLGFKHTHIA